MPITELPMTTSVIMPVLNASRTLRAALESVRLNRLPGDELIVVDDGSSDDSLEVVRASGQADLILSQPTRGPAAARNLALAQARGQNIAFLDADDCWPAHTLEGLRQALQRHPQAGVAQGLLITVVEEAVAARLQARALAQPAYGINLGCSLFRSHLFRELGGFDESLRFDEDSDLWIRLWEAGVEKVLIPQVTLHYRLHEHNMTRHAQDNARALLPLLKRHRDRMRGRAASHSQGLATYLGWVQPLEKDSNGPQANQNANGIEGQ